MKSIEKEDEKPREVVHVRARRGQATDSHSLAERVIIFRKHPCFSKQKTTLFGSNSGHGINAMNFRLEEEKSMRDSDAYKTLSQDATR